MTTTSLSDGLRHDWTVLEVVGLFERPFNDLLFKAHSIHRRHFDPNAVQVSTLLSIKTGACPEDCAYCPQSAHHDTALERERLLPLEEVLTAARQAKAQGASRFLCHGEGRGREKARRREDSRLPCGPDRRGGKGRRRLPENRGSRQVRLDEGKGSLGARSAAQAACHAVPGQG